MKPLLMFIQKTRRALAIITMIVVFLPVSSQIPEAFKYQAVIKDSAGAPVASQTVSVRLTILIDDVQNTAVYQETHSQITSPNGIVNINVGEGIALVGDFALIDWESSTHFLMVEVDPEGGNSFLVMGTSQLLSVPYALFSKKAKGADEADYARISGGLAVYAWSDVLNIPDPTPGMMVFVSDTKRIAMYDGEEWCFFYPCPPVKPANAGKDTLDVCGLQYKLDANIPDTLNFGIWEIVSGNGGFICNPMLHDAELNGIAGELYKLTWKILNYCNMNSDTVSVRFAALPTVALAGTNQVSLPQSGTTLNANTPSVGSGIWSVLAGAGGVIGNPTDPNTTFSGDKGILYALEWRISNHCYTNADTTYVSFFDCGHDYYDPRDLKMYPTVVIGAQCWMAANLNHGVFLGYGQDASNNGFIEKVCYDFDENNCTTFGGLYSWNEAMGYIVSEGSRGICPEGWHIPSQTEWSILFSYLGGTTLAGGEMKEVGFDYWDAPNTGATNNSGFSARGAGLYVNSFTTLKTAQRIWTSTQTSGLNSNVVRLLNNSAAASIQTLAKTNYVSVRCIRD